MGVPNIPFKNKKTILGVSLLISIVLMLALVQVMGAAAEAALLSAEKTVDRSTIVPSLNDTLQYTIVVSNTGDAVASNVTLTDTLDANVNYVAGSLSSTGGTGVASENSGVISWAGSLDSGSNLVVTFQVTVPDTLSVGHMLNNTAEITGTGTLLTPSATTEVTSPLETYMPVVFMPLPKLALAVTRPNSANQWTASWNDGGAATITAYELQESQSPTFSSLTSASPGVVGLDTNWDFAHSLSANNVYYYRVRALNDSMVGPWSTVVKVIGGYRDNFSDPSTNWAIRRTSYLEETVAYYGSGSEAGNLIIIVADKWDWLLASPLAPAPTVPYVVEYRSRVHDASNLVSGGAVYGGDWNFDACPEIGNVYQTDNCFNHFYNFNFIYYGPLKLQYERVDELVWCPNCGGSPLKRIGYTEVIDNIIPSDKAKDWHIYRIEVRTDGAYLYIDGKFKRQFSNTSYINEPYFGVFASTWEYKPSIWFFDYYEVKPLD